MVGAVVTMSQVQSTRSEIVRSRELPPINGPLRVNGDIGCLRWYVDFTLQQLLRHAPRSQEGVILESVRSVGCLYTLLTQNYFFLMQSKMVLVKARSG